MSIPKEILEVKRPKNTVVFAYGKNKDKYGVRERLGCSREEGKKYPTPVEGKTIGHIINMKYVPKKMDGDTQAIMLKTMQILFSLMVYLSMSSWI